MNETIKKDLSRFLTTDENIRSYLRSNKLTNVEILKYAYAPFKENRKIIASLIIYPIVNGIMPVLQAFIMYYLVGLIENNTRLNNLILTIAIYSLIIFICSIISNQIEYKTYAKYMATRLDFFRKSAARIMEMDYGLGENADFMAEFTKGFYPFSNNVEGLEGIYHDMYPLLSNLVSFILISIIMAKLSPLIFVFALGSIIIQLIIRNFTDAYRHKHMTELQKVSRKTERYYKEASDFSYAKDIRLFAFKEIFIEGFKPLVDNVYKISNKFIKPEIYLSPVLAILIVGIEAIAYYFLFGKMTNKTISLQNLTLAITSTTLYVSIISSLVMNISKTKSNLRYVSDGFDMIRADLNSTRGDKKIVGPISIEFEDVSFAYPLSDKKVLDNLSFRINSGQKIAIVGVNGAGKSTIVSLILGLYKPSCGKIYINGIDSDQIDLKDRFKAFATVLQNVDPLAVSIAENVAASSDNINRDRVVESLEAAGLAYKLDQVEKGIDTPMTKNIHEDGTLFSGGENQKLAIARALYKKDAKAIIMDEPTASLDALAEEEIYRQIENISSDKTLIFISHRLASTRFCDKILLLDSGKIKEFGSHHELLKQDGLYKEMYESQKKYYEEAKNEK